jgi:hypothetical protein
VTEAEWATCTDPEKMLAFLRGKVSARKLCLFSAACKRALNWDRLPPDWRTCAEVEERYAGQQAPREELLAAWRHRCGIGPDEEFNPLSLAEGEASELAKDAGEWAVYDAEPSGVDVDAGGGEVFDATYQAAQRTQCQLARDIFGNPFRRVSCDPSWRTPQAVALARSLYDDRSFDALSLLADALEEAGCTDAPLLGHLRGPGPHAHGCWAVDLLWGRE